MKFSNLAATAVVAVVASLATFWTVAPKSSQTESVANPVHQETTFERVMRTKTLKCAEDN